MAFRDEKITRIKNRPIWLRIWNYLELRLVNYLDSLEYYTNRNFELNGRIFKQKKVTMGWTCIMNGKTRNAYILFFCEIWLKHILYENIFCRALEFWDMQEI
jgi:hypothetical protein